MIKAWILFYDHQYKSYHFEEREGSSLNSVDPGNWALGPQHDVILVLQQASFLNAWLEGGLVKK